MSKIGIASYYAASHQPPVIPFSLLHAMLNLLPIYNTLRGIHMLFPVTKL